MTHTSTEQPSIEAIIQDLRESYARATAGTWGKGATTHETVSSTEGQQPYKVADFRHANDAQFCDLAHAFTPRLLAEVESLQKRVQELEASQARVPLSDAEIGDFWEGATGGHSFNDETRRDFVRAIEAAHAITQEKQG